MRSPRPLASRLLLRRFSSPPPKDLNFSISANYPYPSSLPPLFTDLSSLSTSSQFIAASRAPLLPTLLHKFYTTFSSASDFSINGELDIYPLHLFNTPQLQLLLSLGNIPTPSSVLDIGAGVGNVTASFSALTPSPKITCTETSPVMADRLRSLGYETLTEDITHTHPSHTPKYDLISMLNVLDRTPEPASLLDAAHALLRPDGHILLGKLLPRERHRERAARASRENWHRELAPRTVGEDLQRRLAARTGSENGRLKMPGTNRQAQNDRLKTTGSSATCCSHCLPRAVSLVPLSPLFTPPPPYRTVSPEPLSLCSQLLPLCSHMCVAIGSSAPLAARCSLLAPLRSHRCSLLTQPPLTHACVSPYTCVRPPATPLPFRPFYFTADHVSPASSPKQNSKRGKPLQTISLPDDSFDAAAHTLITEILPKHNFEVVAFSRLPYISGGDFFDPYTSLDDIILCARKKT